MIFKLFSFKHRFLLWMYAFCKHYLTCTINVLSILNAMLEYHIGNAQTTLFFIIMSDIGKNVYVKAMQPLGHDKRKLKCHTVKTQAANMFHSHSIEYTQHCVKDKNIVGNKSEH